MEIFGVGGAELVAILIIMLIVAGPKRMIQWAYVLGQYTSKARAMWAETMTYVQKELKEAGMDVELPKEIPTRGSLNSQISQQVQKAVAPISKPLQETLDAAKTEVKQIKTEATIPDTNILKTGTSASSNGNTDLGTWSNGNGSKSE
jgi:Sec-independent protein translocase protein TatA